MMISTARREFPLLVIGAGPAGLSLGRELLLRKIDFAILEQSGGPGHSWKNMWRRMTLNSPWKASRLEGGFAYRRWPRNSILDRAEFHSYLEQFAKEYDLPVAAGVKVREIKVHEGAFAVQTDQGVFRSRLLVNATGYFSNPFTPTYRGLEKCQIPMIHAAEYRDPESTEELVGKRDASILIVGKRLTSGQIASELHDSGYSITISHRSPIRFGKPPWLVKASFPVYYMAERILLRMSKSFSQEDSHLPMQGGYSKRLVKSGSIRTVPDIDRFEEDSVVFKNGVAQRFDLILWATGFRPALSHLRKLVKLDQNTGSPYLDDFESPEVPGLFFLGLDHQRDFTSRMFRGIRTEAKYLGEILERRLNSYECL